MATPAEFESGEGGVPGALSDIAMPAEIQPSRGHTVSVVTILTLFVAILGFLREATLAARFGVSATMDAYFGAIFIPTNIYLILVVGTVSPILIPILLHEDANDHAKVSEVFSVVINFVLILFTAVVFCGVITAHLWLPWLFPGFDTATKAMALRLIYIIFPARPVLALAGIFTATLNGYHKFALAAFSPALSSFVVIAAALLARGDRAIYIVGIGTTIGFVLQFLILVPATRSLGIRYHLSMSLRHPAIRRLARLGGPLLLYLAVANASLVVERNLASRLSAGALSALTYAMRLFTVPSNFLAAPLAIVAYPHFAREALRPDYGELRKELSQSLRFVVFLFLPITVWTVLNALPVTRVLYERGQFNIEDSTVVSRVLMLYGIGILPNAIAIILLRCFYAVEDTITPLWAESIDLVFFILAATLLTRRFGIEGLAVTRGLTFFLVGGILALVLSRKKALLNFDRDFLLFVGKTAAATVVMALVSWIALKLLQSAFDHAGTFARLGILGVILLGSGAAFLAVASLLKMRESKRLLQTASSLVQSIGVIW
jgi:putative peptidoglycan lipid II flippase